MHQICKMAIISKDQIRSQNVSKCTRLKKKSFVLDHKNLSTFLYDAYNEVHFCFHRIFTLHMPSRSQSQNPIVCQNSGVNLIHFLKFQPYHYHQTIRPESASKHQLLSEERVQTKNTRESN